MLFHKDKVKVRIRGRSSIIYEENKKIMHIEAEMLSGEIDLVIYFDSIKYWQPPYKNKIISLDEKNIIKAKITTALQEKGIVIEWE